MPPPVPSAARAIPHQSNARPPNVTTTETASIAQPEIARAGCSLTCGAGISTAM
jgi:hypothetical protein